MNMKITVDVDLDDFVEKWDDESTVSDYVDSVIKQEITYRIRKTEKFQDIIDRQVASVLKKL